MSIPERQAHAFVVRLHRAKREAAGAAGEWRGEVVHVASQKSVSFRGLEGIPRAIAELIAAAEPS